MLLVMLGVVSLGLTLLEPEVAAADASDPQVTFTLQFE